MKTNNNAFDNDAYEEETKLYNEFMFNVIAHDYSHMFSDSHSSWMRGNNEVKQIQEKLHALINICRYAATDLLDEVLTAVPQRFNDKDSNGNDLTHRVIRSWFEPYIEDEGPEYDGAGFTEEDRVSNTLSKSDFECEDGMYYVAYHFDVDGLDWVDEEHLELLILEHNNGVK